jgi:hypothetical protein
MQHAVAFWRQIEEQGWPVPDFVSHLPFGASQVSAWWGRTGRAG